MATETTQLPSLDAYPISAQEAAAEALVELVKMFGQLPGGYVKIHAQRVESVPVTLELQLDTPHGFEQWRAALGIAPSDVALKAGAQYVWLAVQGVFRGVVLELTGFGVPLSVEEAETPQVAEAVAA